MLFGQSTLSEEFSRAARQRAVSGFSYDHLVERLRPLARGELHTLQPLGTA